MHVHVYKYTYTHTHVYIYTCVYMYIYTYVLHGSSSCVCLHVHVHVHKYTYTHIYICTCIYMYICIYEFFLSRSSFFCGFKILITKWIAKLIRMTSSKSSSPLRRQSIFWKRDNSVQHFLYLLWQSLLMVVLLDTPEDRIQTAIEHIDPARRDPNSPMSHKVDLKNPPPWGGLLFTMFPHQEP